MGPVNHGLWAANLSKIHTGIIRILEPIKPPEAAVAESSCREIVAVVSLPITPECIAHPRTVELFRTSLREDADSTAGNGKIELVLLQVAARVGYLHHHFLSADGARRKRKSATISASSLDWLGPCFDILIASTAPVPLILSLQIRSREPVSQVVIHSPRPVIAASVRFAISTRSSSVCVEGNRP